MTDEPIIDQVRLDLVCMGNAELARELIDLLIDEATPIVEGLPALVAAQDATAVRLQAHAVKGIAGNVGAVRLQTAAFGLEQGAIDTLPWGELEALSAGVTAALVELRAESGRTP